MGDPRFFAKIDVGYFDNPKIADLLDERMTVVVMHLRAILYCRQHLTDGIFPVRQVARLVGATWCSGQCSEQCAEQSSQQCDVCEAVHAGLFEWSDTPGRAFVHDYLKHQDSAAQVDERKAKARRAAEARHGTSRTATGNASSTATGNAPSSARRNAEERRGEERRSKEQGTSGATASPPAPPTAKGTRLPDDWTPPVDVAAWQLQERPDLNPAVTLDRFRDYWISQPGAKGRKTDWTRTYRNWVRNERPQPGGPRTSEREQRLAGLARLHAEQIAQEEAQHHEAV